MGRVSEGKGQGRDFCTLGRGQGYTLEKPLLLAGMKSMYKDKNIYIYYLTNSMFSIEHFLFGLDKGIIQRIRVLLAYFIG